MWSRLKEKLFGPKEDAPPGPKTAGAAAPGTPATSKAPAPASALPPPSAQAVDAYFTDGLGFRIREKKLDEVLQQLEVGLLESDVALEVAEKMTASVRTELKERKLRLGEDPAEAVEVALRHAVLKVLSLPPLDLEKAIRASPKPCVILFLGVNGSGKTTTIAKLASWLRQRGLSVVLAAGDTFRAGAIEQIAVHAERLGVKVVRQGEGADPAAVAYDAVDHAKSRHLDVVLIDTAGRQHTNVNLIEEAKKIRRVVKPNLTLFVGDALSGNDMVEQARMFQKEFGFDATVLTKLDTDTKGGSALSVIYGVHRPIAFVGIGQGYGDLRPFDANWMVSRLFGAPGEARS